MTHRLTPLAPDHTHVECEWLFSPEAVEQEDFDLTPRQPRPYTINITGFSSTRLTSAM
jgi:hypothetical protein